MSTLNLFLAYADDFEKTFLDDDWSRLTRHFAPDAVYEIVSDSMPAVLQGPEAIFTGMKKSLDGFDRVFDTRTIEIVGEPKVEGTHMAVGWKVSYAKGDLPVFVLRGASEVDYKDDLIVRLCDRYDDKVSGEVLAWQEKTGMQFDPSYT
ncbi:MAG: hypothetical protein ACI8TX_000318 [Hyphomicrobiaceae bacterium]|jgi:hypothetical protein